MEDTPLHIAIKAPFNSGTPYHNYKEFFNIVIMTICDVNYCFNYIDVRNYGSNSNKVLLNSDIGQISKSNSRGHSKMTLPKNQPILTPLPPCHFLSLKFQTHSHHCQRPKSDKAFPDKLSRKVYS